MIRYKCTVSYLGKNYAGWQTQKNGKSIQELLEKNIERITGVRTPITASGRTDAGVSARGQVFHFDSEKDMGVRKWVSAINVFLPDDIHVLKVEKVPWRFHARHCVRWKKYTYRVNDGPYDVFTKDIAYQCAIPLDDTKMHEAAQYFIGKHDFSALNSSPLSEYPDQVRTVERIDIVRHGHMIELTFQAKGFLRYMVRMMSAAIIEAGKGKIEPADVRELLESCDKSHSKRNAPACGLTLEEVNYYDVMAMSEEAIIREYILKDETDNLQEKEEHIHNRTFPMYWIITKRRHNAVLGETVFDETGIHLHVNKEEDIPLVMTLQDDISAWLSENGYALETQLTVECVTKTES